MRPASTSDLEHEEEGGVTPPLAALDLSTGPIADHSEAPLVTAVIDTTPSADLEVAGHFAHHLTCEDEGKDVERSQLRFDPWLACDHPAIEAMVLRVVKAGEEEQSTRRIRRRRIEDIEAFDAQVRALVTNAAYALALGLEPPTVGILLARPPRKRTRYDEPPLRQINAVLSAIAPHLVTITRSRRKGIASVLMPGDVLRDCVGGLTDFDHTCFHQIGGGETIILRRRKGPRSDDDDVSLGDDAFGDAREVDYRDTRETNRMRAEIRLINAHLRMAPLTVIVPKGEVLRQALNHEQARKPWINAQPVNFTRRTVRRHFSNGSWEQGGRLHGAFWLTMRREDRFRYLRIDGERIANSDYKQLYLRLAYLQLGLTPAERDLYEIPGLSDGGEERRDALKVIVNAMLLANRPLRNWPDTGSAKLFPQGTTFRDVQDAITVAHWPIRELFGIGIGHRFAFLESKMLLETLFQLHNDGDGRGPVCALPLHDSVLVARSRAEEARAVMLDAFERVTGSPHGAVKVDAGDN